MTTRSAMPTMFARAISMEIDAHRPVTFAELFELAHDYVDAESDDAIEQVENLAADMAYLLESARALA